MRDPRKKILLVHHDLTQAGGATAVGAWIIQALKDEFAVTIMTWKPIDFAAINRFQGTSIDASEVKVLRPPTLIRAMLACSDFGSIQPVAYLMRMCHAMRDRYDLVIGSGTEEIDLGGAGILYVHYPSLGRFWPKYRDCGGLSRWSQIRALVRGETRPWMVLADYSLARMKLATILVNSDWTGEAFRRLYDLPTKTLYPPVAVSEQRCEWHARENSFLCIGRITPYKRMDAVIAILNRVRRRQPDLKLYLVGARNHNPREQEYYRSLLKLIRDHRDWVSLYEDIPREALLELMRRVRYGIHANPDEHFGIAPAELMTSGCIVFVHDSGGQVEIVGRDPRLCFGSDDDAVEKIERVMSNPSEQTAILNSLGPRSAIFNTAEFMRGFRSAVDRMIA